MAKAAQGAVTDVAPVAKTAATTMAPVSDGPPHPALQAAGFLGGIGTFNKRLAAAVDAHTQTRGFPPPPGLAFDLARSGVDHNLFHQMLSGPQTRMQARAQAANAAAGGAPDLFTSPEQLLAGAKAATAAGTYNVFAHHHYADLNELSRDPKWAGKLAGILHPNPNDIPADYGITTLYGPRQTAALERIRASGFGTPIDLLATAFGQVAEGLVHAPGGLWAAGTGVEHDLVAASNGDLSFKNTRALGVGMAQAVKKDFSDPYHQPGFVIMDLLGFGSIGASGVSRVAAATRAEGIGAKASALATKPRGGTVEIGREGATEHALVSDNPLVGAIQKLNLNRRQKALETATINGEKVPAGFAAVTPDGITKWLDQHFSMETKVGREKDARMRVAHTVAMTLARELDHVIGGAAVIARTWKRLPGPLRNGLTRGESKAIQTISFGKTPAEQIASHRIWIDAKVGDPKEHLRQIADLHLAQKILDNPNPSKRFRAGYAIARQVADESEALRIDELGLSPVRAANRIGQPAGVFENPELIARRVKLEATIGKLGGLVKSQEKKGTVDERLAARLQKAQEDYASLPSVPLGDTSGRAYAATGTEPVLPFYTKLEPRTKTKRPASDTPGYYPVKAGPYGVPLPRGLAELDHEFTGKSIVAGNFRIDAAHLTSEAYGRTVRTVTVLNEHARLWKSATDERKSERFDVPIRDAQKIPGELRAALQDLADGGISQAEAESLPADMQVLLKHLYPDKEQILRTPIDGVKWIDSRSMGAANEIPTRPGALLTAVSAINEPLRDMTLFIRPAYLLNALGNAALLVFDEGFAAVPSLAKALYAKGGGIDADTYRTIKGLVGQGRSKSYTTSIAPKLGQKAAQAWSVVTDEVFRVASFIYYAKRLGYDLDALPEFVKTSSKDLVEVKRRSNKATVEFDNLTEVEKNTLRHFVFVYPWVSRSTVWSLRAVMEHPAKTDFLAQLGEQEADSDPLFKHAPAWVRRTGYFIMGWNNDGTPNVLNPTSINTFSTLGDITQLLSAGLGGDPGAAKYTDFGNILGPAGSFLQHAITGTDQFGNRYPDHQWLRAAGDALTSLPQVSSYGRAGAAAAKNAKPLTQFNITNRATLEQHLTSAIQHTVFSPGWLNGYGSLISGGMTPRAEDPLAAEARWLKDATPEQRHKVEVEFLLKAVGLQADFLKTKAPAGVRTAVKTASDLTQIHQQFLTAHGRPMTEREQTDAAISYLADQGKLTPAQQTKLKAHIPLVNDNNEISLYRTHVVLGPHGGYTALAQWDEDVRNLYSFRKEVFGRKAAGLQAQGLLTAVPSVSQPALFDYGRKYLAYTKQAKALAQRVRDGKATAADMRVFQDEHDKPVAGLPSFTRMDWANTSPQAQQQALHTAAGSSWQSLSGFEKTLLGVKTPPSVTAGWKDYDESAKQARDQYGQSLDRGQIVALVNGEDKLHPGFAKDWQYAQKPKVERFEGTVLYKQMPAAAKSAWDAEIGPSAKTIAKALTEKNADGTSTYKKSDLLKTWHTYLAQDVPTYLDQHPALKRYLAGFNRDFLSTLEEK